MYAIASPSGSTALSRPVIGPTVCPVVCTGATIGARLNKARCTNKPAPSVNDLNQPATFETSSLIQERGSAPAAAANPLRSPGALAAALAPGAANGDNTDDVSTVTDADGIMSSAPATP